jgi:hypothetical protein
MTAYYLSLNECGSISELVANDDRDAISQVTKILGYRSMILGTHDDETIVEGDDWCSDGVNDDGEPQERILFWASEEDAENDSGSKAIASLSRSAR